MTSSGPTTSSDTVFPLLFDLLAFVVRGLAFGLFTTSVAGSSTSMLTGADSSSSSAGTAFRLDFDFFVVAVDLLGPELDDSFNVDVDPEPDAIVDLEDVVDLDLLLVTGTGIDSVSTSCTGLCGRLSFISSTTASLFAFRPPLVDPDLV
jgi:hypothetical protein